ncbi:hypothetical protein Tco_0957324 [Tanacetum coccineum]
MRWLINCHIFYRRRDDRKYVENSRHQLHNGYIISYNATLLKRYQFHINIEWCNQTGSIKYLFKYINKGSDRVSAQLYESVTMADGQRVQKHVDEIKALYDCRYISMCEAAWRIFGFEIHYRTPYVERLSFHIPGEQQVVYDENSDLETVIHQPSVGHSMFEDLIDSDDETNNVCLFYIEELMRLRGSYLRHWPEMPSR